MKTVVCLLAETKKGFGMSRSFEAGIIEQLHRAQYGYAPLEILSTGRVKIEFGTSL